MKKALVTGISGQDGAYLAKLLLENGYDVCGTSRDAQISSFHNLERLGIRRDVQLASVALNDFRSVLQVLFKVQPDEIYNLAGQSSVSLSLEQPVETQDSIYLGTLNLLEAIRFTGKATSQSANIGQIELSVQTRAAQIAINDQNLSAGLGQHEGCVDCRRRLAF